MGNGKSQFGFTYLAVLLLLGLISAGLTAITEIWSHTRQREKETELIWIGNQFRRAIALYYQQSPGIVKRWPEKLDDLLEDRRHLPSRHYLRKIYVDPMTGKTDWALVPAVGGGFHGVHSRSDTTPIKSTGFGPDHKSFAGARNYTEWRFIYEPVAIVKR
jgi:type II secretory pathway pseudopilin PulG